MKRILPVVLIATRKDCGFAKACNPSKVSVDPTVGSAVSRTMTRLAHECCAMSSTRESLAPSGFETARSAELIFNLFIVMSYNTGPARAAEFDTYLQG